ncbi:MAG: TolC family protein [Planctomycetaceae bacterium]|nr:TolC family protein [Planctomycetaceae bacterium]
MNKRIAQLIAAGFVSTAGWMVYAADPVSAPHDVIRLRQPVAAEPISVVTPQTEQTYRPVQPQEAPTWERFPNRRTSHNEMRSESRPAEQQQSTRRQPIIKALQARWFSDAARVEERITQTQSEEIPGEPVPLPESLPVATDQDEIPPPPSRSITDGNPEDVNADSGPFLAPMAPEGQSVQETLSLPPQSTVIGTLGAESYAPPYVPSNNDADALPWMSPFEDRASMAPVREELSVPANSLAEMPAGFVPWWETIIEKRMRNSDSELPINVDLLTIGALQHAPQVLSLRTDPNIRNTYLCEESAAFDWKFFWDTKWTDSNTPVGNSLTLGDPNLDRFKNHIWTGSAGLRRRNPLGGEFEISQRLGYEDQNSTFFIPPNQGTTRLQVTYTQPLLAGGGVAYNRSRIMLAQVDSNRSFDEVSEELQTHLTKVTEAYWELYRARAAYLQRQKLLISAEDILETLAGRQDVDALQRQVLRAQAAVAGRRAEIVRSAAAIRNAESRLRLLVNDPQLLQVGRIELVPIEYPRRDYVPLSMTGSLQSALNYRPDISQAIRDLRSAGIRLGVAENELLPRLDLVLQTYVNGLAAGGDIGSSLGKQVSEGRPSYSAGLEFEVPLGNRAANARVDRRQLEMNRAVFDFRTVVETGLTEVELAVREAETSYREMMSQYQSLIAAQTEASYLDDRWRWLPGGDRGTTLLLEDLLDAQERLADTESEFVASQVAYVTSLTRVRQAMGTLLQAEMLPFEIEQAGQSSPGEPELIMPYDASVQPLPTEESVNNSESNPLLPAQEGI